MKPRFPHGQNRVSDLEGNAVEKAIVIQISDSLEDADKDGIADASDPDDDNDGTPMIPTQTGWGRIVQHRRTGQWIQSGRSNSTNHAPTDIFSVAVCKSQNNQ